MGRKKPERGGGSRREKKVPNTVPSRCEDSLSGDLTASLQSRSADPFLNSRSVVHFQIANNSRAGALGV